MSKYKLFKELPAISEQSRYESAGVRLYVPIKCPHCNLVFTKIPVAALKSNKPSKCKAHLAECTAYTFPPATNPLEEERAQLALERQQLDAEKKKQADEKAQLALERQQLDAEKKEFQADKHGAQAVLSKVKEWGKFTPPDETIVLQLEDRDKAMKRDYNTKINDFKRIAEKAYDKHTQEIDELKKSISKLKRQRTPEYKLPDRLMEESTWARKKAMIAFAPDKQPSEATKEMAMPLFKQASSAEPRRDAWQ